MYVAHAVIEMNTSEWIIHITFNEEEEDGYDDYESLLALVVVMNTLVIVICNWSFCLNWLWVQEFTSQ